MVRLGKWWWLVGGAGGLLLLGVAIVTAPIWLRPVAEAQASAAIGRRVTIDRLRMSLSTPIHVTATNVRVASPAEFIDVPNFAIIQQVTVALELTPLLRGRISIPEITITGMIVTATETSAGANNYTFVLPVSRADAEQADSTIGIVRIVESRAHVLMPRLAADIKVAIRTEDDTKGTIVGDVTGTYAGDTVTGQLIGGAILGLREGATPYAVDVRIASGESRLSLIGTVRDLLQLGGADLKLELAGQDMAALYNLTGIPFPPTPPFRLASAVNYADGVIHLGSIVGRLGSSDITGALDIDTRPTRPVVSGEVESRSVDLQDLAGFIGSQPGRVNTPDQTPAQQRAVAQAVAHPRLIPNLPMDLPKIQAADFHIKYRGASIIGRSVPFDSIATRLDIENGHIMVSDFRLGVGKGEVVGQIDMTPVQEGMRTKADIELRRLDVGRMLKATNLFQGDGILGGRITIDSVGKSLAEILGRGTGNVAFFMAGGTVTKLIVDLSGLQLGEALLAALGLPEQTQIRCLIGDLALVKGTLQTRSLILDTTDDRTVVHGTVDLRAESIAATLRTSAKHFTIGTLATPIAITGTLKNPAFAPESGELGARSAAAVGLGLLLPPAALLPTIQLGIGEDNACVTMLMPGASRPSAPSGRAPVR